MYEIDPSRLDLAHEFRRRPLGHHSPELQAVLDRMRSAPIEGKHCLIVETPRARWLLARMTGNPLRPVPVPGVVFTDLAEAEWTVFKLRWHAMTGHDLATALGELAIPEPPVDGRPVVVPDPARAILAYADRISAAPGDSIAFKVSTPGIAGYRADIVRLRAPQTGQGGEGYRETEIASPASGDYSGGEQALRLGSYIELPALPVALESFSLQVLAWPTLIGKQPQALLGAWSQRSKRGFGLHLDEGGALTLRLGDGSEIVDVSTSIAVAERRWHLFSASFDAASRRVELSQRPLEDHSVHTGRAASVTRDVAILPAAPDTPLMIAAWSDASADGLAPGAHYNGKLEASRLFARALPQEQLDQPIAAERADGALVAAWDFSQEIGSDRIVDHGPHRLHGRTVNLPTRAVTGHNWDAAEMDWKRAPQQYGAIHFHDDDIDDARWQTSLVFTVPEDCQSGIYAARLRGEGAETHVPFFVRPPRGKRTAKVAYLAPTATYTIYANNKARFLASGTEMLRGHLLDFDVTDMQLLHHPIGLSTYCVHNDGSGVCYGTRLRPMTNFRPKGRLWNFSSDLFVVDWLEAIGCGYDVVTDDDLHREGAGLLDGYQAVLTGSHPEYVTLEMMNALEGYLKGGGRLMYLGGNGFYWRVAYHPQSDGIIEVRRAEDGTRAWHAAPGEYYMSFTGEYGGLWSRQGRSPNTLAGVGFIAQGFDASSHYRRRPESRDPRAAFIFAGIEDEILGDFGHLGGGAAGDEIDACDVSAGSPPHTLVLASSENHTNAFHMANDAVLVPNGATNALQSARVRADMVFFECPSGGAVFSTGSIAYVGSLAHNGYDNTISRLTRNVLDRFLDPAPFAMPGKGG